MSTAPTAMRVCARVRRSRPCARAQEGTGATMIYVQYKEVQQAKVARMALQGRMFAGAPPARQYKRVLEY